MVLRPRIRVGVKVTVVVSVALRASKVTTLVPGAGVAVLVLAYMTGLPSMLVDLRSVAWMTWRLGEVVMTSLKVSRPFSRTGMTVLRGTVWVTVITVGTELWEDWRSVLS